MSFNLGNRVFKSRLLLGSGRYPNPETMLQAIYSSGTEIVTVSLRRFNSSYSHLESCIYELKQKGILILPNTAGCKTAKEAVYTAQLAREALETEWIKLEVIGHEKTLLPDVCETLKAAELLVRDGFFVLPYTNDDLIVCKKLEDLGCAAVMPLGSPIGSGMGILNTYNLCLLRESISIPLILDAGIGTASDAVRALELGLDAVLINTAVASAEDPVGMASSMKYACMAGRLAYESGRIPKTLYATASSPL